MRAVSPLGIAHAVRDMRIELGVERVELHHLHPRVVGEEGLRQAVAPILRIRLLQVLRRVAVSIAELRVVVAVVAARGVGVVGIVVAEVLGGGV